MGSGCGADGRVIVFDTRDLQFESHHRQIIYLLICRVHDFKLIKIFQERACPASMNWAGCALMLSLCKYYNICGILKSHKILLTSQTLQSFAVFDKCSVFQMGCLLSSVVRER